MKIVIVGAGVAGLACANYLQKAGFLPLILEASDAVGGRLRTDTLNGYRLDRGFQVFNTAYPEAQALLNYPQLKLQSFRSGAMIRTASGFDTIADPFKDSSVLWKTLFSNVGTLADKLRILRLSWQNEGKTYPDFSENNTSTLQFLEEYGFSESMIQQFFRPFFGGVFLENDLATSAAYFQFIFNQFYQGEAALPAGGIQAIPEQLAQNLAPNSIRLHTEVSKIEGREIYLSDGQKIEADAVILATDAHQNAQLLGKDSVIPFRKTTCTYFAAEASPSEARMLLLNPNRHGVVHHVAIMSDVAPSYAPEEKTLVSVSTTNLENCDEVLLTQRIRKELGEWFGTGVETWQHLKTYHLPQALPAVAQNPTTAHLKVREGVYQCGDFSAYPSLNAAMQTGRMVAEMVREQH